MKRLFWFLLSCFSRTAIVPTFADFDPTDYSKKFYDGWEDNVQGPDTIDRGKQLGDVKNATRRDELLDFLGIKDYKDVGAIGFIKSILNVILAFAAFIALCFMIYGFGKIFFGDEEKAVSEAWTIVRISAIALAIIAAAWFIESAFFYIYEKVGDPI
jgi:hypothetical protein